MSIREGICHTPVSEFSDCSRSAIGAIADGNDALRGKLSAYDMMGYETIVPIIEEYGHCTPVLVTVSASMSSRVGDCASCSNGSGTSGGIGSSLTGASNDPKGS